MSKRAFSALELTGYVGVCALALWIRLPLAPSAMTILLGGAIVLYPLISSLLQKKSVAEMGLDPKAFWPGVRLCLILVLIAGPLLYWEARKTGFVAYGGRFVLRFGAWQIPGSLPLFFTLYPLFAILQQYIFLGFLFDRLTVVLKGRRRWAAAGTAALFVASHVPNPTLTLVTIGAGPLFVALFLRHRNFIPIACLHGVLGALLFFILQRHAVSLTVGVSYLLRR